MPLASVDTPVAFRTDSVELIERGVDTVLRLRPARAGSVITPTSATVTITDAGGTAVVSAGVATCTADSGQAVYTVLAATTAALALGEGWKVTWAVLLPGETVARAVVLEGALVLHRLYPVATDQDLFQRVSSLDPSGNSISGKLTDFSPYLDAAWSEIQDRLMARGDRPWLVMSPHTFRRPHVLLTLALVFEDLRTRLNQAYADAAADYRRQFADAWADLRFQTADRSGLPAGGGSTRQSPGSAGVWLGGVMR